MAAASTERTTLEARMSQPLPSAEIAEAGKRLKALNDEIGRLEERWLALSDQLEALAA
jgi:ATP-binding cassette subfamily F protein 3